MKKYRLKTVPIFTRFLLGYLLIIFIVSIAFFPIYSTTLNILTEKTQNDNVSILNDKLITLDSQLIYLKNVAVSIGNYYSINLISNVTGDQLQPLHYFYLNDSQKYLRNILFTPKIIENCFFMFDKNNVIISRDEIIVDFDKYYKNTFRIDGINDITALKQYFSFGNNPSFKAPIIYIKGSSSSSASIQKQVLPYIIPSPEIVTFKPSTALLCLINLDRLEQFLIGNNPNYGYLQLLNNNGDILYSYTNTSGNINLNKLIPLSSKQSPDTNLQIIAGITPDVFAKQIQATTLRITLFFVITLLMSVFLAFYLSYRNNLPIKHLKSSLESLSKSDNLSATQDNFYQNLEQTLLDLERLKNQYTNEISSLKKNIEVNLFDKLIHGNFSEDEHEILNQLPFINEEYIMGVIKIDYQLFPEMNNAVGIYGQTLSVLIPKILDECIDSISYIHNINIGKCIFLISLTHYPKDQFKDRIIEELNMIVKKVKSTTGISCTIGVSERLYGYQNISVAYSQAWDVLRTSYQASSTPIVFFNNQHVAMASVDFDETQKLYRLLIAKDKQQAINLMDSIFKVITSYSSIEDKCLSRIYYNIQNILIFSSKELFPDEEYPFTIKEYSPETTVKELFDILKEGISAICDVKILHKNSKSDAFIIEYKNYICENYLCPNLSTSMIAEHFSISERHLFTLVKGHFGKTVGEYIEELRMKKAMELLENNDHTVADIAIQCGFNSQNTFYKAFKRITGIAPAVWRENKMGSSSFR